MNPKPTTPKFSMKNSTNQELISESAAIRIDCNLTMVYYFTHTTRGPCDSPNRSRRAKGYSRQLFPTRLNH